jgi:hypothetical protein
MIVERLTAGLSPNSANSVLRTVDCIFYSGADADRYSDLEGKYVLRFDPAGADLSLLNNGAPILFNHECWRARDQLGRVVQSWQRSGVFMASLQFKRSTGLTGPRPRLDGLWQDITDKIVSKFSMGVQIVESVDQRDRSGQLQVRTANAWSPFEISIAPIPGDFATDTLSGGRPNAAALDLARRQRELEIARLL